MTGEVIWAFPTRHDIGSIVQGHKYRWNEGEQIDPTQPMYILREATREEWIAHGGRTTSTEELFFYAVSVD